MKNLVNSISDPTLKASDVTTLLATPGKAVKIEGKSTGAVTRVPVVIGKTLVQIYINAEANLEEPALDITNVKHDLHLTGCDFIQEESIKNGKLLVGGYIRENLEYTSAKLEGHGSLNIGTKRTSMDIPFRCFTKMQLDTEPEIYDNTSPENEKEASIANLTGAKSYYYLNTNEGLNYEVAEAKIQEVALKRNVDTLSNSNEQVFSSFSVNMSVELTLLILQNQFIQIPSAGKSGSDNSKNSGNGDKGSSGKNGNSSNSKDKKGGDNKGDNKSYGKDFLTYWSKIFSGR